MLFSDLHYQNIGIVFYRNKKKVIKKKFRNGKLLVLRIGKNGEYLNSKPCLNCIKFMKQFDIKTISYSDSNGDIITEKIDDIVTNHVSNGNKQL